MFGFLKPITVGNKVVVQTTNRNLPGGVLHSGTVVEVSEHRTFALVRYDEDPEFAEWVMMQSVERYDPSKA